MTERVASGARGVPSPTRIETWDTSRACPGDFAAAWYACLEGSPHAQFSLDLEFLTWESKLGRPARALLLEQGERRAVLVMHKERGRWISGWPWRWQALVRGTDPSSPVGMSAGDARWLHAHASRVASPAPLTLFLPVPPAPGVPGWAAGATILQDLQRSDDELLDGMEPSKRRLMRRAQAQQIEVATASRHEDFRAFHQLQQEVKARRRLPQEPTPERIDEPGMGWREWELPWMWLLLARRHGAVVSGLGDGIRPGGMLEGRTSASTLEARRLGATVLLGFEEARLGRDLGHRWLNHGGDTPFKREMSGRLGRRVRTYGWMGGGSAWRPFQFGEAMLRAARPALARIRRGASGVAVAVVSVVPFALDVAVAAAGAVGG